MSTAAQTLERARLIEIDYCRSHMEYYIETYVHIEDKDADEIIIPFKLWPAQKEALRELEQYRLNIIMKTRQVGFSWLVLSFSSNKMLKPGWTTIAFSRAEDQGAELVRRLEVIFSNMPALVREDNSENKSWTGIKYFKTSMSLELRFPDGQTSLFKAFPAAGNASISFTANLLFLDEWAEQEKAREIWAKAFPNVNRPTGGKVIGLSTNERGTLFEEIFIGDNEFNKIFIPWYADPRRTPEWYEKTCKAIGDAAAQQYPSTVEEALSIPGGAFFPEVKTLTHLAKPYYDTTGFRRYVTLDYGLDMLSAHWIWIDRENNARVYRELDMPDLPISEACKKILKNNYGEKIDAYIAPPDLWSRSTESGKSRAIIFCENGIQLTKASNDFEAGCNAMKEWLKVREDGTPALMIDDGAAPNLFRCLTKIQKEKNRPNVYAKEPHELTHDVDSLRYFAVYYTRAADAPKQPERRFAFDILRPKPNPLGFGERIKVI